MSKSFVDQLFIQKELYDHSCYLPFIAILLLSYALNLLIHLMLVEVLFRHGENAQLVELIRTYVFRGRVGAVILWLFFLILVLAFISSLTAYISGAGEIIASLTGLSLRASRIAVYVFAAGIVFFGLKIVGVAEKISLYGVVVLIVVLLFGALQQPLHIDVWIDGGGKEMLALYGMVMYSLFSFFAVPQVFKGLAGDKRKIVYSVATGLGLNGLLIFLITSVAVAVSNRVTEIAIVGIGEAVGPLAQISGSLFIVLAMLTSYWSISLALADNVRERTGVRKTLSWVIATVPTLILIGAGWLDFLDYLKIAGGATALMVVLITVPLFLSARKNGRVLNPDWSIGRWGHPAVLSVLFLTIVLVAAGSLMGIGS